MSAVLYVYPECQYVPTESCVLSLYGCMAYCVEVLIVVIVLMCLCFAVSMFCCLSLFSIFLKVLKHLPKDCF